MARERVVPGPKGRPIAGCAREIGEDRIEFLLSTSRQYGELVHFKVFGQSLYLVSNPDYVKEILVTNAKHFHKSSLLRVARFILGDGLLTSEDDFHRRQRRMIQPTFHSQRVNRYGEIMIEFASAFAKSWEEFDGHPIDVWDEMMRLTLAIVSKTLFGASMESEDHEIGEALKEVISIFERVSQPLADLGLLLPTPKNLRVRLARRRIERTMDRIIRERRASGEDRGDLLSMLLKAQDEDDGGAMTDKQVRHEMVTLFLAGHETTANALTWAWYLLALHPEIERKLHAELDSVLGGNTPAPADVPRLEYARRVFAETMRLYPPAYLIGRTVRETFRLDGYEIPRGAQILLCPFVTHRNAKYFPDPLRFDPDRWAPELQQDRHKFAYYPFGSGPRTCVGEPFAWMEGILLLSVLAQRWRLRLEPGHPVEYDPQITLRPKHGMTMRLERRAGAGAVGAASNG
ncbi:MAG: cytochrome P450 [Candidatus Hydrogenedentes bacterium]|nr:cytochrome P450 [Candidatus Hydrogenedentota bacterium]